jgi:hypothetical protein
MIDVVERPPKYNGAFRRPLKLMAVYNLRNQQAVTCNTGVYTPRRARRGATQMCALYVFNPCLLAAKTLLFLAILWGSPSLQVVATGQRRKRETTTATTTTTTTTTRTIATRWTPTPVPSF